MLDRVLNTPVELLFFNSYNFSGQYSETWSGHPQISNMMSFMTIGKNFQLLIIITKL